MDRRAKEAGSQHSLSKSASSFGSFLIPAVAFLLVSAVLTLYPLEAKAQCNVSGDIPFRVSSDFINEKWCIMCKGPWLRESSWLFFNKTFDSCQFYAADETMFSPFGSWVCAVIEGPHFDCTLNDIDNVTTVISRKYFCLEDFPGGPFVDLDVSSGGSITVNASSPPCSTGVSSFLGDNLKHEKSKRDVDEFNTNGKEGDEVTLTLESDPQAGNNGGEATLMLTGNSLRDAVSGALPIELTSTLPATGEYSIVVAQPKGSNVLRYRGAYMLTVDSSLGDNDSLSPAKSVER
jgi:hypothetical protein